ncbi:MAG: hypothetical protein ACR2NR_02620, partial [Solirubrobacteraceae bacterium]
LALATIAAVEVLGAFRAPRAVKAALASRTGWLCRASVNPSARWLDLHASEPISGRWAVTR